MWLASPACSVSLDDARVVYRSGADKKKWAAERQFVVTLEPGFVDDGSAGVEQDVHTVRSARRRI